jgi:hypothetical protein
MRPAPARRVRALSNLYFQHQSKRMANPNRSGLLTKLHKVLRKHFKPVHSQSRAVLEQLLYACCLENARYQAADQAFAAVSTAFFDWNEVRVSMVKELAEVMHASRPCKAPSKRPIPSISRPSRSKTSVRP